MRYGPWSNNGAVDPDLWSPSRLDGASNTARPKVGQVVAWRYAAWRVDEVRDRDAADLTAEHLAHIEKHVAMWRTPLRPGRRAAAWPFAVVLRHERGPFLVERFDRLSDGGRVVHLGGGLRPDRNHPISWTVLAEPYRLCSCHVDPWPCQDIDRAEVAAAEATKMDKLMATAQPGVCAHCLEPISTRQRVITFPEESRWVPGASGPTFHAGRGDCWEGAEKYERTGRLVDDPSAVRVASCPGLRFIHEGRDVAGVDRLECTAGPLCTGLHGPSRRYGGGDIPCWHRVDYAAATDAFARPARDCGYRAGDRGCLAQHIGGSTAANEQAGDLLWQARHRADDPGRII